MEITVAIPVYNDWESVRAVIQNLDSVKGSGEDSMDILLIDDGSTAEMPPDLVRAQYASLVGVSVLRLRKNLGHQKAIAVALCYLEKEGKCDVVLIMDGDGEDKPSDAMRLVARLKEIKQLAIVFAERTRRSESFVFKTGYGIYRFLHIVLTGRGIRVGNFSAIPRSHLPAVTVEPMLWNHYAASVMRGRLPTAFIPTERGTRVAGRSHLNLVSLVIHGLAALACYAEIIGVRMIFVSGLAILAGILGMATVVGLKIFTNLSIPGWTSLLLLLIIIMVVQIGTLVCNFTMQIISARNLQPFLPCRDYVWFVGNVKVLFRKS